MKKFVPKDNRTRERVINELDKSFAIEAGAGTGKTTLLTRRILNAVKTGHATLGQIVAITFTDLAANELKVRIRSELELSLAAEPANNRLADALAELDVAHISTIHSFCSEILREFPVEAGVDCGFQIADEMATQVLFDKTWDEWLSKQLADADGTLREAFAARVSQDSLRTLAERVLASPGFAPEQLAIDEKDIVSRFEKEFVPVARDLIKAAAQEQCESCSCGTRARKVEGVVQDFINTPRRDRLAKVAMVVPKELKIEKPRGACKEHKESCIEMLQELAGIAEELVAPAAHAVAQKAFDAICKFVEAYQGAKRKNRLVDFDDLLIKTRNLLHSNKEVRKILQRRFKMILLDECQDTDPIQNEIAFYLAEDGAADMWDEVKITPGKLLFVGDPKQSIYRFRRADIEMYQRAKEVVQKNGELVYITQNFRSADLCVDWVNSVFSQLIRKPEDGNYQPEYIELDSCRKGVEKEIIWLEPPADAEPLGADQLRRTEAVAVAQYIRDSLDSGMSVFDKEQDKTRTATPGDFAILFRTRQAFEYYERALSALNIPYRSVSGRGFFARQEVHELRAVLSAIERPFDGLAVVGALRTSLLGISDNTLAQCVESRFDYVAMSDTWPTPLEPAFTLLARWHSGRNGESISRTVERVMVDTNARELYYLKPGGEQRVANLWKVVDAARAYESQEGATFGGFVHWLKQLSMMGEESESPAADDGGDYVQLLTMHKAKGLEFPVVVLADLAGQLSSSKDTFFTDRQSGICNFALQGNYVTSGYQEAKEREKLRAQAEYIRLLYVAATRARDQLVVPAFPPNRNNCSHIQILSELGENIIKPKSSKRIQAVVGDIVQSTQRAFRFDIGDGDVNVDDVLAERAEWRRAQDELIRKASVSKRLRTASAMETGAERETVVFDTERSESGRLIGKATHAVLEKINLLDGANIDALVDAEIAGFGIGDKRKLVRDMVARALKMDIVKRAAQAKQMFREVPFSIKHDDAILEGLIDLAFIEDGLVLADYKTDDVSESELERHADNYRLQIGAYALAAEKVFGERPRAASLLFLRLGREVPVKIDDALLREVAKRL